MDFIKQRRTTDFIAVRTCIWILFPFFPQPHCTAPSHPTGITVFDLLSPPSIVIGLFIVHIRTPSPPFWKNAVVRCTLYIFYSSRWSINVARCNMYVLENNIRVRTQKPTTNDMMTYLYVHGPKRKACLIPPITSLAYKQTSKETMTRGWATLMQAYLEPRYRVSLHGVVTGKLNWSSL